LTAIAFIALLTLLRIVTVTVASIPLQQQKAEAANHLLASMLAPLRTLQYQSPLIKNSLKATLKQKITINHFIFNTQNSTPVLTRLLTRHNNNHILFRLTSIFHILNTNRHNFAIEERRRQVASSVARNLTQMRSPTGLELTKAQFRTILNS
jgi:hypothetical protein